MKKGIIIILLFAFSPFICFTQLNTPLDENLLLRYWYYRRRLDNNFLKVGHQRGESIPLGVRMINQKQDQFGNWIPSAGSGNSGDAGVKMAYYIGVLATEYRLLKNNNRHEDAKKSLRELYYALEAVLRLDNNIGFGEDYFDINNKQLDGCFHRGSDAPANWGDAIEYPDVYAHFNNSRTVQLPYEPDPSIALFDFDRVTSDYGDKDGIAFTMSDYTQPNPDNDGEIFNIVNSQDHVLALLWSFRLVQKCVGPNQKAVFNEDGTFFYYNFDQTVKDQAGRMVNYVKERHPDTGLLGSVFNTWVIDKPDGTSIGNEGGAQAFGYAFALAQADNLIHGNNSLLPYLNIPVGSHNEASAIIYKPFWNIQQIPLNINQSSHNNENVTLNAAVASNAWTVPSAGSLLLKVFFAQPERRSEWTLNRIKNKENVHGWGPFWSLLHMYVNEDEFNDATLLENRSELFFETRSVLNSAPCEGPSNFHENSIDWPYTFAGDGPWHASNQFANPECARENLQVYNGKCDYGVTGLYNGMDYMLLHNLYYLSSPIPLPEYRDMVCHRLENDVNGGTHFYGGLDKVIADNVIFNNANVTIKAPEFITLTPGFSAQGNSSVDIVLGELECNSNGFLRSSVENNNEDQLQELAYGFKGEFERVDHRNFPSETKLESELELVESYLIPEEKRETASIAQRELEILLFPNPASNLLHVKVNQISVNKDYKIINSLGVIVDNGKIYQGASSINIERLSPGAYRFILQTNNGIANKTFIKQ